MDYGDDGEVRLVKRNKGKKRAPPAAAEREEVRGRERDSGGRGRFDSLRRDYNDLLKDTEMKRRRLESINQRKPTLLAEVKFLQKKLNSFKKNDSKQAHYWLKKQAPQGRSRLGSNDASPYYGASTEVPSTSKRTNLDLNQDSVMNDELANCLGARGPFAT